MWVWLWFCLAFAQGPVAHDSPADTMALVIGVDAYAHAVQLSQSVRAAREVGAALRAVGFSVSESLNPSRQAMVAAIHEFARHASGAEVAFVYYAGHGIQVDGSNYLIPADALLEVPVDANSEAVNVGGILDALADAQSNINVLVLDTDRNNPWGQRWHHGSRGLGERGLVKMTPPGDQSWIIAYATAPGSVSSDSGQYASALAAHLQVPCLTLPEVFASVRDDIVQNTQGYQRPWLNADWSLSLFRFYPAGCKAGRSLPELADAEDVVLEELQCKRRALLFAAHDYQAHPDIPNLATPWNDIFKLGDVLRFRYGFDTTLVENPTRKNILDRIRHLGEEVSGCDSVIIYYAGHGEMDPAPGADRGFWLPVDADPESRAEWVTTDDVVGEIRAFDVRHVLLIVDSCFSGTLFRGRTRSLRRKRDLSKLSGRASRWVFTSGGEEPVRDKFRGGMSVFAYYLYDALKKAKGEEILPDELFVQVRKNVKSNSDQVPMHGPMHKAGHEGGLMVLTPGRPYGK